MKNITIKLRIILAIFALFLIIVILFYSSKAKLSPTKEESPIPTTVPSPTATPYPQPTPLPTQTQQEEQTVNTKVIPGMPVSTPEFTIEYLYTSNSYIVTILKNPYEGNKQRAEQWFKDHGVQDLQKLDITYIKDRFVQ